MLDGFQFSGVARFQEAIFVEARIFVAEEVGQVQGQHFDNFVFPDWSGLFFVQPLVDDFSDCGVVFFSHVMMMIDFVIPPPRRLSEKHLF
jgi:hypothetical protein